MIARVGGAALAVTVTVAVRLGLTDRRVSHVGGFVQVEHELIFIVVLQFVGAPRPPVRVTFLAGVAVALLLAVCAGAVAITGGLEEFFESQVLVVIFLKRSGQPVHAAGGGALGPGGTARPAVAVVGVVALGLLLPVRQRVRV